MLRERGAGIEATTPPKMPVSRAIRGAEIQKYSTGRLATLFRAGSP